MFVVFGLALVCAFQFLSAMRKAMRTGATSGTQTAPGTLFRHCTGKAADGVQDGEQIWKWSLSIWTIRATMGLLCALSSFYLQCERHDRQSRVRVRIRFRGRSSARTNAESETAHRTPWKSLSDCKLLLYINHVHVSSFVGTRVIAHGLQSPTGQHLNSTAGVVSSGVKSSRVGVLFGDKRYSLHVTNLHTLITWRSSTDYRYLHDREST